MVEIKRLNKLWSSDSIHLREYLDIPIFDNVLSPTGDGPVLNGNLKPTDLGSKSNISPSKGPAESLETSKVQPVDSGGETSIDQILSRIDSNIKSTAKNVKRMAKNSR